MLSQTMSLPSWWIHYLCFIDQVPVMPLQGTLVSKGFLPAYIMALERSARPPGLMPFVFYSEKKGGKRHSQAIIHFKKKSLQLQST